MKAINTFICCFIITSTAGCTSAESQNSQPAKRVIQNQTFVNYWNQGKAELTRYALEQARYGEIHKGDAVLVFVTEDFLTDKQVKLESKPAGRNVTPVLKLNLVKNFNTGIYSYSLMTSVFTPIEWYAHPHSLKLTASVQEWCGHVWSQFNLGDGTYHVRQFSYFEHEGDRDEVMEAVTLEDEIWTMIRLDPKALPTGQIKIIPSTLASRLLHFDIHVVTASARLEPVAGNESGGGIMRYTLSYTNPERVLSIDFNKQFPYQIQGWTETYVDGFGKSAQKLTTRAVKTNTMMLDYWARHNNADDYLRQELGIEGGG